MAALQAGMDEHIAKPIDIKKFTEALKRFLKQEEDQKIMIIDFEKFTESLSTALDYAEKALLDVEPMHGLRVAFLTYRMAKYLGFSQDELFSLTQAAALHDCALSEYLHDEVEAGKREAEGGGKVREMDMASHCIVGEEIMKKLPFYACVEGAVLYHHDRADGQGAMGLKADETPLGAQLIHISDCVDVKFSLYSCDEDKLEKIQNWVRENSGTVISEQCADAFLKVIDYETLEKIAGNGVKKAFEGILPEKMVDISLKTLREMASVFAVITDYKSHFTYRHSMGIAEKAEEMGRFYKLSEDECDKLFIAGALHDVGKLLTSNEILEKPDKLTDEEYVEIQNHAVGTWVLLQDIKGLEEITRWAANHHEKLDGTGYPYKLTGDKLDKNSRLLACLDIYQALVEDRPYKAGMKHEQAMNILNKMGDSGKLDKDIIKDIDICFGQE